MKIALIILGVVLALVLIGGLIVFSMGVSVNNDLVRQQEAVKAAWSQVDIALQRRADLIPNLVETVKGYATHEKDVIASIANARAALGGARTPGEKIAANGQLDSAISRLLLVVENYPNLKANENFLRLQDELAGTENRIAVERHKYNETLQRYNTNIGLFPNNLFASMLGFHRNDEMCIRDSRSRIEVGYGLEPVITDGYVGGLLRSLIPSLRSGDYAQALADAAHQLGEKIAASKGVAIGGPAPRRTTSPRPEGLPIGPLVMAGIIFLLFLFARGRGAAGASGGGFWGFLIGMLIGNLLGGGGGPRSGGGGGFGGFDSGDSFGGFGGGDSGGGGASGSW